MADLDGDGDLDAFLACRSLSGVPPCTETQVWLNTQPLAGDADQNGVFDSGDLIVVFQAGEYEDHVPGNSTWSEGDWNDDGDFDTADLILAFQQGHYLTAATPVGPFEQTTFQPETFVTKRRDPASDIRDAMLEPDHVDLVFERLVKLNISLRWRTNANQRILHVHAPCEN